MKNPIVMRFDVPGTPQAVCQEQALGTCGRHGHFVVLRIGEAAELIVNLMLAGRFHLCGRNERNERSLCLAFGLDRGEGLRYLDDKHMGKTYLVPVPDKSVVPGFDTVGIDPLSPDVTVDRLREMVCSRRDQVRAFLLDKTATVSLRPIVTRGALSAASGYRGPAGVRPPPSAW